MSNGSPILISEILYYIRESYYNTALRIIDTNLKINQNDSGLEFYKSIIYVLEEKNQEAFRILENIKHDKDVGFGANLARLYIYRKFSSIDKFQISEIEKELKDQRKKIDDKGLYYGAYYMYTQQRYDKAKEYAERSIKMNSLCYESLSLKAWLEMPVDPSKAIFYFDKSLSVNQHFFDALLGISKTKKSLNQFAEALDAVNRILVKNPYITGVIVEKMKLQLCTQDWDQCSEVVERALSIDNDCLEALRYKILDMLCRNGNYKEAANEIENLFRKLEKYEPNAHHLFYDYSKVFSRLCGRNQDVLKQTEKYIETALSLNHNVSYLNELGVHKIWQGKIKEALKYFNNLLSEDKLNLPARLSILKCNILNDELLNVEQEFDELLKEFPNLKRDPEFKYLKAIYSKKINKKEDEILKLIDDSLTTHFKSIKDIRYYGTDYFYELQPDFVLDLTMEYISFVPSLPVDNPDENMLLNKCNVVLATLNRGVPGLLQGALNLARIKFLMGDHENAKSISKNIFEREPAFYEAYLLLAEIYVYLGDYKAADKSLEYGLSSNFEIKKDPKYNYIKAKIYRYRKLYEKAIKALESCMEAPGVKTHDKNTNLKLYDRASIYLELHAVYILNGQKEKANKIIQEALVEFSGTTEEARFLVSNVDTLIDRGEFNRAIDILNKIRPTDEYYMESQSKLADIYLDKIKKKDEFIKIYINLVDKFGNHRSLVQLGDAYMKIIDIEKAINAYEKALDKKPDDVALAKKIGQCLIKSHEYKKAVSYYITALKKGQQKALRYDLAELYFKLNKIENAEKLVSFCLSEQNDSDIEYLYSLSKCHVLNYEINKKCRRNEQLELSLTLAKEFHIKVTKKAELENSEFLSECQNFLKEINRKLFEYYSDIKDYEKAEKSLKEAISNNENDINIQIKLAEFYLKKDDLNSCIQLFNHIELTSKNPIDEILFMKAIISLKKGDLDGGMFYFDELFEKKPGSYDAFCDLAQYLFYAGKIEEASVYLEHAEENIYKVNTQPGYNFAKATFLRLSNKVTEALKYYNKCRGDIKYGKRAIYEMVNLCLNPENDLRNGDEWLKKISENDEKAKSAQFTAFRLLESIKGEQNNDIGYNLAENYCLMHTNEKSKIELALKNFLELESLFGTSPSLLIGIAECYLLLKAVIKARNYLKNVSVIPWNIENAETLEKSELLLASLSIMNSKFDQALESCKKCIDRNKSCRKAYEYIGMIYEKEGTYKDAAENYQKAWNYCNKSNPSIGYKLAFNYLKDKKYANAIDISNHILNNYPEYPRIKKEILDPARENFRT